MEADRAYNIVSGEFWGRNPHEELAWLRANDPVYFDEANQIWGITRYDHVREISTTTSAFSSAQGTRPENPPLPMMIEMDEPAHSQRRDLVENGFQPRQVRAMEPAIINIVDRLIDGVNDRDSFDFVTDVAAWLPLAVIGDCMGMDEADHPKLLEWSDDLMNGLGVNDPTLLAKTIAAFEGWKDFIAGVIEDRRANPRDDLISQLVHAEIDGVRLSDDDLVYETLLILIGGDETTRHVITGGIYQLMHDRDQWERLRDDRTMIGPAVEEMLRWTSPIRNMARSVVSDVEFYGKKMLAGQKVLLLYPSANRDEDHFVEPFTFDIARSPNDHVAFGVGPHFCLGASLARLEVRTILDRLLDRMPRLELVDETEPAYRPANFISGYETMLMTAR